MPYKGPENRVSRNARPPEPVELSIGTLSSATGVPIDTLRTWERRYGFPVPIARTGGSHRRYAAETIGQLQLIVRALELGHRPSAVVGRDLDELRRLVGPPEVGPPLREPAGAADARIISAWLEHTRALDAGALLGDFQRSLAGMSALEFLERRLGPYLQAMGRAWARGALHVSQEHFASEKVREFLSAHWRGSSDAIDHAQACVVFATPPGEHHALGLHMAAWVVALAGARVVFLGTDVPLDEIAFAVERQAARGVVVSVAAGYRGSLREEIEQLQRRLPATRLAVGGAGARGNPNEQILSSLFDLFEWTSKLLQARPLPPVRAF